MISQETIEEVKSRSPILEVVGDSISLKRNGSRFIGLCPFHTENTPSFSVNDEGYYHCFGCGESGNVISFVMRVMGLSFPEAVEYLANRFGIEVRRESGKSNATEFSQRRELMHVNRLAGRYYLEMLKQHFSELKPYLDSRSISNDSVKSFGLGFAPTAWRGLADELRKHGVSEQTMLASGLVRRSSKGDLYDLFRGRLIFPILIARAQVAAFGARIIPGFFSAEDAAKAPKYLNSPESLVYRKSQVLYGLFTATEQIRRSSEVVITEGYLDVIGLWQVGIRNAVATCGTALTAQHVRRLSRITKRAQVIFDGDRAGRAAAAKAFEHFLNSGIDARAVFLPEGHDPHSFASQHAGNTGALLEECQSKSLLACYIAEQVLQLGEGPDRAMGAAAKGVLCNRLGQILAGVQNSVERTELLKEAAFELRVGLADLQAEMDRSSRSSETKAAVVSEPRKVNRLESSKPTVISEGQKHPEIDRLPAIDQEILTVVMALKGTYADMVLSDPELCFALQQSTRQFIEGLREILATTSLSAESELREQVLGLLKRFGPSWIGHWKQAHHLQSAAGTNLEKSFIDCRRRFREQHLRAALLEVDKALLEERDEALKAELARERIRLERQIRDTKSAGKLIA